MSDNETEDFWPEDLLAKYVKTPKRILAEQAAHLNRRGGFVQAQVETREQNRMSRVSHEFSVVCDTINRRALLFRAEHSFDSVYPCNVRCVIWEPPEGVLRHDDDDGWKNADGEVDLQSLLREILRSAYVRSVIESMQSQAAEHIEEQPATKR